MRWLSTAPKVPGFYWIRSKDGKYGAMLAALRLTANAFSVSEGPTVEVAHVDSHRDLDGSKVWVEFEVDEKGELIDGGSYFEGPAEFAGPILPPK